MDNEAFRKLIRANIKSTKEIAREAVEEEFQTKRKRGRGGGSSDEDDDDKRQRNHNKRKQSNSGLTPTQARAKREAAQKELDAKYRDRAKERREGKKAPPIESGTIASKEEDDKNNDSDEDLEHAVEQAQARRRSRRQEDDDEPDIRGNYPKTVEDAKRLLEASLANDDKNATTSLGKEMLIYLRASFLPAIIAAKQLEAGSSSRQRGHAVQRSTLSFSTRAEPGNVLQSWEIPSTRTNATLLDPDAYVKASPLAAHANTTLLDQIQQALAPPRNAEVTQQTRSVEETTTASSNNLNTTNATEEAAGKAQDSDDDDDIFGDVGDDYDPTAPTTTDETKPPQQQPKGSKTSIFGDTATAAVIPADAAAHQEPQTVAHALARKARMKAASGLSTTHAGHYGEDDMDADFDGTMEYNEEVQAEKEDGGGGKTKKEKRKRKKQNDDEEDD